MADMDHERRAEPAIGPTIINWLPATPSAMEILYPGADATPDTSGLDFYDHGPRPTFSEHEGWSPHK